MISLEAIFKMKKKNQINNNQTKYLIYKHN